VRVAGFDPVWATQILANRRLEYKNIDFKELNLSASLGCDDYRNAIMRV
jgi:hypothetical protein